MLQDRSGLFKKGSGGRIDSYLGSQRLEGSKFMDESASWVSKLDGLIMSGRRGLRGFKCWIHRMEISVEML